MKIFFVMITVVFFGILGTNTYYTQTKEAQGIWRDFYGILQINQRKVPSGEVKCLLNGAIIHGCQPLAKEKRMMPTTYFGENSAGLALQSLRKNDESPLRIGVIGLGVGTIATYAKKDEHIKFYELNPLDIDIAKTKFTYLTKSPAKVETVAGDGRLSMEKELRDGNLQKYNLFVIDAFNDDAIPVHLLTKEAFELYKKHLAPNSIIAINISNRYLDLTPVIVKAADHVQMNVMFIDVPAANDVTSRSQWAFLSNKKSLVNTEKMNKVKRIATNKPNMRLWTDDYSNLYQLFKYAL